MKRKIQVWIAAFAVTIGLGAATLVPAGVSYAATCSSASACVKSGLNSSGGSASSKTSINDVIKTVINVLLFLIAAISVIMIIIGGFKYTVSNGDSNAVSSAKNTIMYAVVGLLIAIFAYAIVNFVVTSFVK